MYQHALHGSPFFVLDACSREDACIQTSNGVKSLRMGCRYEPLPEDRVLNIRPGRILMISGGGELGLQVFAARIAALFFPNRCLGCHQTIPSDTIFCSVCERQYGGDRQERFFPLTVRRGEYRQLSCHTAGIYAGGLKQAMGRLKFQGKTAYAHPFAVLMRRCKLNTAEYDAVTCVPMTDGAKRKRGYNQSELLGKAYAKQAALPYEPLLKKVKDNRKQRSLTKKERTVNVRGVYEAFGNTADRRILLVDDILTTGATLMECAAVLYRAGAKQVCGLCAVNTQEMRGE